MSTNTNTAPTLRCPVCDAPVLQAEDRGRFDKDGNFIRHRCNGKHGCCGWVWWDDQQETCGGCGAVVRVEVEDGYAYSVVVPSKPAGAP